LDGDEESFEGHVFLIRIGLKGLIRVILLPARIGSKGLVRSYPYPPLF